MKKMNQYMQLLLLSVVLLMAGCTGDFEDMNRNPNQVTDEEMDVMNYKTGTKVKALQSLVVPVQEHMYQFNESLSGGPFGGYIGATVDTWRTKFETFNPSADWRKWPFANVITETYTPYRGIVNGTEDEVAIAFAKLLRVAIMHRVTDSYGPIPYSNLENNESITVVYDAQKDVYAKMFEELDAAIEALGRNTTLPAEAWNRYDAVYYGNIAQWVKYANSLKLRMAMRMSYVDEATARTKASEAIAGGVITANADNAAMHAAENRTTLIYNDWGDHRVGADILCYMTGYNDPRLEKMFLPNDNGKFVGIRIGIDVTSKSAAVNKYSNMIVTSATPYMWRNAAETAFLRAEYELRWGSAETARSL
ncbi:MAG: SusD/RagB family nutrient-binding outer membrane lipoprotein, partial [Alistipes sp.]|nr:SusD/RagB family nutrient-binding outer membrane lipoprotein [Alistipes sp.]